MKPRLLLLLAFAALLFALFTTGSFDRLDAEALRTWIREARFWGPLLFVLLFAVLEPVGFPGLIFMLTAVAVWPAWQAWLLIWAGAVGAGVVGYSLARWIARDWVQARLSLRFVRLDAWVARNALSAVILMRLFFFILQPAHWALGLSRVSFGTLVLGSVLGFAPTSALIAFSGAGLVAWLQRQPPEAWGLALAGILACVLVVHRIWSRRISALGVAPD